MHIIYRFFSVLFLCSMSLPITSAIATEFYAGPTDYESKVSTLQPGDTLHLEAGTYNNLLNINNLNGDTSNWITITGPESGDPAIFVADPGPCCNTVEIRNSSYVAIKHITIDGNHVGGAFGISAKDGLSNLVHHILIENCILINHDNGQQTVAISTKTPTWGWIIRRNQIIRAGTGLYLGNSNGEAPFVAGIIEDNLFVDPLGYCMQIKWQLPRPSVSGMPEGPSSTIIRNNVFIKSDRVSPSGDRPNLLVGGFPDSGAGSEDIYEIYGNFFFHNPRESLLQASGRVTIHDNIFVDVNGTAIRLQNHDLPLRMAHIYNNTIYSAQTGIGVGGSMDQGVVIMGNLVFADVGISGTPTFEGDNIYDTIASAQNYVINPSIELGAMNFYPLVGTCQGTTLDLSQFNTEIDYNLDFNGNDKDSFTFRGAYAGDGENPGWLPDEEIKDLSNASNSDAGTDSDEDSNDAGTDSDEDSNSATDGDSPDSTINDDVNNTENSSSSGCSCQVSGNKSSTNQNSIILILFVAMLLIIRFKFQKKIDN